LLGFLPKGFEIFYGSVLQIAAGRVELLFHPLKAALEFAIGFLERRLGLLWWAWVESL
jgi:hypothetical protein